MKVCVAQSRPLAGDIPGNVDAHRRLLDLAIDSGAETIVFPELSITGYEPSRANDLAIDVDDSRFELFQSISDASAVTIGVGVPTRSADGVRVSMMLFQPEETRQLYSKMYLHADEAPFFVPGVQSSGIIGAEKDVALAICHELSVPQHAADAHKNGARVYVASVSKSVAGIESALARLREVARDYSMTVFMANAVGTSDGAECAGRSSVWNSQGELVCQLDGVSQGLIVVDTKTQDVRELTL